MGPSEFDHFFGVLCLEGCNNRIEMSQFEILLNASIRAKRDPKPEYNIILECHAHHDDCMRFLLSI